jgi:nucleolar protein 15
MSKVKKSVSTPAPAAPAVETLKQKSPVAPGAGVIFLSHIPHGFYEDQMRAYFSQFGEITRLRMARNRTTGASKHYAYIEFRHLAVAKIVAETMHNYLIFGRLLKCQLVEPEALHPEVFKGANRKFKVIPWQKISKAQHNAEKSPEKVESAKKRQIEHIKSVEERCRELGIDWDASELKLE